MKAVLRRANFVINFLVIISVVFAAVSPTPVSASPDLANSEPNETKDMIDLQEGGPQYYNPPDYEAIKNTTQTKFQTKSDITFTEKLADIDFQISTDPDVVSVNKPFTVTVVITNNTTSKISTLLYVDELEEGVEYVSSFGNGMSYDSKTRILTRSIGTITSGSSFTFTYKLKATDSVANKLLIHQVSLNPSVGSPLVAETVFTTKLNGQSGNANIDVVGKNGGWHALGDVRVHTEPDTAIQSTILSATEVNNIEGGPEKQYQLELYDAAAVTYDKNGNANDQVTSLGNKRNAEFAENAYIEFNFDDIVDLKKIPAGKEPYVAVYDEENEIWVKVPIVYENEKDNTVTVESKHFSVWGTGLGDALPQNGVGALLFSQPYTSLFTGASNYSIPISVPAGRAGVAPSISLSYSSSTVDGVLGDVQAPWVGVGWNIDDIEVVRKITTDEDGYGYENNFSLTINGTIYELSRDTNDLTRYYVEQDGFLYIERHNAALGNDGGVENDTREWWEVVTSDGTRYRLGWNEDSEQLALMYGYSCTVGGDACISPDGAYASLGYAGLATDMVARRWRVDRITDINGNFIDYTYREYQPGTTTLFPAFDRESYLHTISYTGYVDSESIEDTSVAGYQVHFDLADRSSYGDVPENYFAWDDFDSKVLDAIRICLGSCEVAEPVVIRTYDMQYGLMQAPNANGTITLTGIVISGGGYSEGSVEIPYTASPKITLSYTSMPNRQTESGSDAFYYPRLDSIDNGYGGVLSFQYATDGRDSDSWYNYRVTQATTDSGLGLASKTTYNYETPVYTGVGGDTSMGELIGYTKTTETSLDFNAADAPLLKTVHEFGTAGLDIGKELVTEWMEDSTVLQKKTYAYITDNSQAPCSNWNYRYLSEETSYILINDVLTQTTRNVYYRDGATGNLFYQLEYVQGSLYRKTYYEYSPNTDPAVYLLNLATRQVVVDANNQIFAETRYRYDGNNSGEIALPTKGHLSLLQNLTGSGSQTTDATYSYDEYGNVLETRQYTSFGATGIAPSGNYQYVAYDYDATLYTYPVQVTNALGNSSQSLYLFSLGRPYQVTDANGWVSRTSYDGLGRNLSVWAPGLSQAGMVFSYPAPDSNGKVAAPYSIEMQVLDTTANTYRSTWSIYDGLGRILQNQVYNADTSNLLVSSVAFDAVGRTQKQSVAYTATGLSGAYLTPNWASIDHTAFSYDILGRTILVTAPGGISSTTSYDGLTTTIVDPNGNRKEQTVDPLGRMVQVQEYSGESVYATTQYDYDIANRLTIVTDAYGYATTLEYNWLGQKTSMSDLDMGEWSYVYDPTGNLISQTDAREQTITLSYDALNRLVQKTDSNTSTTLLTNVYGNTAGSIGMRVSMEDASGTTEWVYSNYGRTVVETRDMSGEEVSVASISDWLGRTLQVINPENEIIRYSYDALGREFSISSQAVGEGSPTTLATLGYNALSQILTVGYGSGVTLTNTYDSTLRLSTRSAVTSGNTTLIDYEYTYDDAGNITEIVDNKLSEIHSYTYDSLNRLTSAHALDGQSSTIFNFQYSYNKVGNILQISHDGIAALINTQMGDSQQYAYSAVHNAALINYSVPQDVLQEGETETPTPTATETVTETVTPTTTLTFTPTAIPTNTPNSTATSVPVTPSSTPTPLPGVYVFTAQPAEADSSDTYVQNHNTSTNYYSSAYLLAGTSDEGEYWQEHHSLLKFDLSSMPENAIVTSATLYLRLAYESSTYPSTLSFHRELRPWVENQATWSVYATGLAWDPANVGGLDSPNIDTSVLGSLSLSASESTGEKAISLDNAMVQEWIDGTLANNGMIFHIDEVTKPSYYRFYSANNSTESYRPKLVIEYTLPSTDNDPTLTPSITPTVGLDNELIGYWPADEIVNLVAPDIAGAANNGSVAPYGVSVSTNGHLSNAYSFDGYWGYVNVVHNSELSTTGSFSLSAWVNPQEIVADRETLMVDKAGEYSLGINTDGCLQFTVQGLEPSTIAGPQLPVDQWNLVSAIYNSTSEQIQLFVNDTMVASAIVTGTKSTSTSALVFGSSSTSTRYKGLLDEVRYYNRALSTREVQALYGSPSSTATPLANTLTPTPTMSANTNVAAGLTATSSTTITYPAKITDGNISTANYASVGTGLQWIQFDLGQFYNIYQINVWHYLGNTRNYHDVIVELCSDIDCTAKTIVFNNDTDNSAGQGVGTDSEYAESLAGKTISVPWISAQFVRIYSNGAASSTYNYYSEVQVWTGPYVTPTPTTSPTATPTPTVTPTEITAGEYPWGTGADGSLTVNSGVTYNISTQKITGACLDGGDGVSYSITSLTDTYAELSATPSAGCLSSNDEILLINMQGSTTSAVNTGNYETLRIQRIEGNKIYFNTQKLLNYGETEYADDNIGISAGQQRVVLQRVPNYSTVHIDGTLTTSDWNGYKGGILVFRASETLTVDGTISANYKGFVFGGGVSTGIGRQGESYCGAGAQSVSANCGAGGGGYYTRGEGGGGGHFTNGQGGPYGTPYGIVGLGKLFLGSGGGGGGGLYDSSIPGYLDGGDGGDGGGIVYIAANQISCAGTITAKGQAGEIGESGGNGGGGSGGSVLIRASTITGNGILAVLGGSGSYAGSAGRSAIYYTTSFTSAIVPDYLENVTLGQADSIFGADLEVGDLSEWNSTEVDGGHLSVSSTDHYWGNYGLSAQIADTNPLYVQDDTPNNEKQFRSRFYFDPNSLTMGNGDAVKIYTGIFGSNEIFYISLQRSGTEYQVQINAYDNDDALVSSSWQAINDGWNSLEVEYFSNTSTGQMSLLINGQALAMIGTITNSNLGVDSVRLGAQNIPATTSGVIFFDDYESRRFSAIGSLPPPGIQDNDSPWGDGSDGSISIISGATTNIMTTNITSGRSCPDGGDGIAYNVLSLSSASAQLDKSIRSDCLSEGDEVILINMQGSSTSTENTGLYEFLHVESVVDDVVFFSTPKIYFYGETQLADDNIGISTGQQRVVVQRIPNYENVTIAGTLTTSDWDGLKGGLLLFRVSGTLSGPDTGVISANYKGFVRGGGVSNDDGNQGESYCGAGIKSTVANCGGGGGGNYQSGDGSGGSYASFAGGGQHGDIYGILDLSELFLGSGGGGGAGEYDPNVPEYRDGGDGGDGGGVIFIAANSISWSGTFSALGASGTTGDSGSHGGGGSGGSVLIQTASMSGGGSLTVAGGGGNYIGSSGRSAIFYSTSYTSSIVPNYLENTGLGLADTIFGAGFEIEDLSEWTSSVTDGGDLDATEEASYWGMSGMSTLIDDTNDLYVQDDSPAGETQFHARFYVDPNSITMASGDILDVFTGLSGASDAFTVQMQLTGGQYQVRVIKDTVTNPVTGAWYNINDDWNGIEIEYYAANETGEISLFLNGELKETLAGLDTVAYAIDSVRLGRHG